MGSSSKGGGASGQKINDYYGTIACILCTGPIDRIVDLWSDGKKIWPPSGAGLDRAGQPNPVQLTIEGYGTGWLYWGTSTQTLDASGEAILTNTNQPPYRNQAVLVLRDFLFGREKVSAPSIEATVIRKPQQSVVTGAAAELDADGQANPIAILAELYTSPIFGLGLPAADLDATSWQTIADELQARAAETYISAVFDRPASVRSLFAEIAQYYDGWFRLNDEGKIVAGRNLHGESAPTFGPSTTLTADDLVDEPELKSSAWQDTFNEVAAEFSDRENNFKDTAFTLTSAYNRQITGEPRQAKLELPYVTRREQMAGLAAEFLKVAASPAFKGTLRVRAAKGLAFPVGTLFQFNHDLLSVSFVARVIKRTISAPPSETITLEIEAERGIGANFAPIVSTHAPITQDNGVEALPRYYFATPLPPLFGEENLIVLLVARQKSSTVGFNTHWRAADATQFQQIGPPNGSFSVRGQLAENYSSALGSPDDDSETLRVIIDAATPSLDIERVTQALTEDEVLDETLLMWLVSGATTEVLSVRALRLVSGQWYAKVRRAIGGTTNQSFLAGATVWLARRDDLTALSHASFANLFATSATVYFRLQAIGISNEIAELSNGALCPDITLTLNPVSLVGAPRYLKRVYKLSPTLPATPTGVTPAGWSTTPPAPDGVNQRWVSEAYLTLSSPEQLIGSWTTPTQLDGFATVVEWRYKRDTFVPSTPTGNSPAGWSTSEPGGSDALWASFAHRIIATGDVLGDWSTPIRKSGNTIRFDTAFPNTDLAEGDAYIDTDDNNKAYRFDGSSWVASFTPFIKTDGSGRVEGLQKADGTDGYWVMVANAFQIWNGTSAEAPFEVVGGITYIKNAVIQNAAIGTLKIAGNAVTAPVFAVAATAANMPDNTWTNIVSVSCAIEAGQNAFISISFTLSDDGTYNTEDCDIEIRRASGTVIHFMDWTVRQGVTDPISFQWMDSDVPAAVSGYDIYLRPRTTATNKGTPSARSPALSVVHYKR